MEVRALTLSVRPVGREPVSDLTASTKSPDAVTGYDIEFLDFLVAWLALHAWRSYLTMIMAFER
jgi:hypothetical protein